ncbi:hypothetical protein GGI25_001469 [Coemansia spiralis]|uniref:ATP11-domain-containing protein n=2 Tax=Coemansia TaxID=4863 RepID=A0A9W8G9Y7_9FUNG|nr:ATP11 protein-domain-containing protein [Coemansia spiralis]KAJ1994809.1 hypothetical protein EDC05_001432 [Coemansia umbellata]KAJ2624489.1 hypothetical protein GGI26_001407 [Coemansia sp. RSA 1358]KAJ2679546.1 hypothetical protein GGI25_001469 [Coemansia spiralis]
MNPVLFKVAALAQPAAAVKTGSRRASHMSFWPWLVGAKHLSNVPDYEEKYRDKLLKHAHSQGVETVEQLKQKIKQGSEQGTARGQKTRVEQGPSSPKTAKSAAQPATARRLDQDSHLSANNLPPTVKSLDQIMRTDKLLTKSAEEITALWTQYHATKDMVSAAIPLTTYQRQREMARHNPLFVLPLPRDQGMEFFFMQCDHHQVHFTSLLEYKANTTGARPYLTLTHYTDFSKSHGLVLMRGEIEARLLGALDAQYLVMQMQRFYLGEKNRGLVERFNQRPESFDYSELVEAAQKL